MLQKNKGAKLDSFLSQKLVYAAAVEAVERPVPPAMSGVEDGDYLRLQNVSLNRAQNERLTDAQKKLFDVCLALMQSLNAPL